MGHTQSSMSEVLDSGLKWVLGQNASVARTPPTYDHPTGPTGTRVARDTSSLENGKIKSCFWAKIKFSQDSTAGTLPK